MALRHSWFPQTGSAELVPLVVILVAAIAGLGGLGGIIAGKTYAVPPTLAGYPLFKRRIVAAKRAGQVLGPQGGLGALPDDLKHVHAGTLQEHLQAVNKLACV